jgi:hypothetical protein
MLEMMTTSIPVVNYTNGRARLAAEMDLGVTVMGASIDLFVAGHRLVLRRSG